MMGARIPFQMRAQIILIYSKIKLRPYVYKTTELSHTNSNLRNIKKGAKSKKTLQINVISVSYGRHQQQLCLFSIGLPSPIGTR